MPTVVLASTTPVDRVQERARVRLISALADVDERTAAKALRLGIDRIKGDAVKARLAAAMAGLETGEGDSGSG